MNVGAFAGTLVDVRDVLANVQLGAAPEQFKSRYVEAISFHRGLLG